MDRSPQTAGSIADEIHATLLDVEGEEGEEHIHMPGPSYWPLLLSVAVAAVFFMLLLLNSAPLLALGLALVAGVFAIAFMIGWGLEDPFKSLPPIYVPAPAEARDRSPFKLGLDVVDARGSWLGTIQARFPTYLLVERGHLFPKVYYVPRQAVKSLSDDGVVQLNLSEADLQRMGYNRVPEDLYIEPPEPDVPRVRGIPQFGKLPLSPAQTGHYLYGARWPGINTDAKNSYHLDEIQPDPSEYVSEGYPVLNHAPARSGS
ncbi:MAG: hypothetical protein IRZ31_09335 [Thermogemmatispora sp.]|uniref:hypothetical protein n=1 Tax=Thermogemmatispora sp. TaxID=1968838 RepID=UPI002628B3E1|nr:hypothetical protein [Thermogemmatispora sp.]MBX5457092.1 hypothetical protein [Thermogemmatispora sp.]